MKEFLAKTLIHFLLSFLALSVSSHEACPEEPRINQVQVVGTHNSYHIEPHASMMKIMQEAGRRGTGIEYTHRPLATQFSELGIRQIELDVRADDEGGLFANPLGLQIAVKRGIDTGPAHDPNRVLLKPGLKVLHATDYDFRTTVLTFVDALMQVKKWSTDHPDHFPIMVMVEVKGKFETPQLDGIDAEILIVFEKNRILKPDDVRGELKTLREAVLTRGWPTIDEARGKVMFALDNEGDTRDRYLEGHPGLQGRMLFVSVKQDHPAAAFMKLNEAINGFDHIQTMVKKGFLVRTRADIGTRESRTNDPTRRDKALASGAQFISSDYPEPDPRFSRYRVRFGGGIVVRTNPVNGDPSRSGKDLEAKQR